jgi:hypothetical protein
MLGLASLKIAYSALVSNRLRIAKKQPKIGLDLTAVAIAPKIVIETFAPSMGEQEGHALGRKEKLWTLASCLLLFVGGWYLGYAIGVPFAKLTPSNWAIGVYTGSSPLELWPGRVQNPVLTRQDVTDVPARFVADPFMVRENETWHMFLEVLNEETNQGDIAYATSQDGLNWTYRQVVLDEPFHVTYPYVFDWQGEWYMIPETHEAGAVRLYKATDFPVAWYFADTLLEGKFSDPSVLRYDDRWWLFAAPHENHNHRLRLYYADELLGTWLEHPMSPIVDWNGNIARPGGRVLVYDGRIIRYAQDALPQYGTQVYAFEISELTLTSYREEQIGSQAIIGRGDEGWNSRGMHHLDPHPTENGEWIAAVDGRGRKLTFETGTRWTPKGRFFEER